MGASTVSRVVNPAPSVRLKLIALPTEHGGWGLLAAPVLLALLLRPSASGAFIGLAALGAFLARHPFKLAAGDLLRGKCYPRTAWAWRFTAMYSAILILGLAGAFLLSSNQFWPSLLACAGLGALDLWLEVSTKGRTMVSEVLGAVTLSLLPWPLVIAGGGSPILGIVASTLLALQSVGALLYVRARLRLEREGEAKVFPAYAVASFGFVLALLGALLYGLIYWTLPLYSLLLARTAWGLSPLRQRVRPGRVGIQEVAYSMATVIALYLTLR